MTTGWIEQVAEKAGVSIVEVDEAIKRLGITPQRSSNTAKYLTVTHIAFKGEKRGNASGTIDFNWNNLTTGIWALASHKEIEKGNLVGKSTILEIILGTLRGKLNKLQPDVLGWLESITLEFLLGDQMFIVEFSFKEGQPIGSISQLVAKHRKLIDNFTSHDGFAAVMNDFMLEQLGLSQIPTIRKADEGVKKVLHGWPALGNALHFGGDHKQLFGDKAIQGLPGRMFHMYIGLPWALPLMQAKTIKMEYTQEQHTESRRMAEIAATFKGKLEAAKAKLKESEEKLSNLVKNEISTKQLDEMYEELASFTQNLFFEDMSLSKAKMKATELRSIADEDDRYLRTLKEDFVARRFFNGLRPSCCPRCETSISKVKQQLESEKMLCSVCSEPISGDQVEDIAEDILMAEQRKEAALTAAEQAEKEVALLETKRDRTYQEREQVSSNLEAAKDNASYQRKRDLEIEISRLEGFVEAHTVPKSNKEINTDQDIVKAVIYVANKLFEEAKDDILNALNSEILDLGIRFGIAGLEKIDLNSAGQMSIIKGNEKTSFSKLTSGERLRIRLATAIALLRIGKTHGVGRHPGILLVDSPGSEELADPDLTTLLKELKNISEEMPDLQVFVASANANAVRQVMDPAHCIIAPAGEFLW